MMNFHCCIAFYNVFYDLSGVAQSSRNFSLLIHDRFFFYNKFLLFHNHYIISYSGRRAMSTIRCVPQHASHLGVIIVMAIAASTADTVDQQLTEDENLGNTKKIT